MIREAETVDTRGKDSTRQSARRLGLVTLAQMVNALVDAVENPPTGIRIVDVPAIRAAASWKTVD